MPVQQYKELRVWQKSIDLVELVYEITRCFPKNEMYSLTKQLRRAAVSVPSNIAEGQGRGSTGEFRQFLGTARGSLFEVETQIVIALRLGYVTEQDVAELSKMIFDLSRMLHGLIAALPERRSSNHEPRITSHD